MRGVALGAPIGGGLTPAHLAAGNGQVVALRALRDLGSDLTARDVNGRMPAPYAAVRGHVHVLRALDELGVDRRAPDAN
jgi:ankyrin repeat protein